MDIAKLNYFTAAVELRETSYQLQLEPKYFPLPIVVAVVNPLFIGRSIKVSTLIRPN